MATKHAGLMNLSVQTSKYFNDFYIFQLKSFLFFSCTEKIHIWKHFSLTEHLKVFLESLQLLNTLNLNSSIFLKCTLEISDSERGNQGQPGTPFCKKKKKA